MPSSARPAPAAFRARLHRTFSFASIKRAVFGACLFAALGCAAFAPLAFGQDPPAPSALVGHASAINRAVYTPDGSLIATAGADQLIKLWDAKTGKELRTLQGHQGQVLSLSVHPSGRLLVSGAADNTLKLWDLPQPDPLHVFAGHAAAVADVVVSPDGRTAVTGSADKSLRLWDLEKREVTAVWEGHEAEVLHVAYRADGNQVASGDAAGRILLWNVITGQPTARIGAHLGPVAGLVYHPDNQQLISVGDDGQLKVWQLPPPAPRELGRHEAPVRAVAVAPNGQIAAVGSGEQLQFFNLANGQSLRTLPDHPGNITSVQVSPDNALAAVAGERGAVQLWGLADGANRGRVAGHHGPIRQVVVYPDNQRLATAGEDGTVRRWRLPVADVPLAGIGPDVWATTASPDGQLVVAGAADGQVRLFNAATGQLVRALAGHAAPVRAVRLRGDGGQLASGDESGSLRLWNVADGVPQAELGAHAGAVRAVAYHPGGEWLVTAGGDGSLKRWSLPPVPATALAGHAAAVTAVDLHAETQRIVTGSDDKTVRVFDAANGQPLKTLAGPTEAVTAARLSADGKLTAAATASGVLHFWNTEAGTPWAGPPATAPAPAAAADDEAANAPLPAPAALIGHDGPVHALSWHTASGRIASAGTDGTVRVWRLPTAPHLVGDSLGPALGGQVSPDGKLLAAAARVAERPAIVIRELATGRIVHELLGHAGPLTALAFHAGGTRVVSASADKTARVWDLSDPKFPRRQKVDLPAAAAAVALSADASQLITAGADNTIRLWPLPPDAPPTGNPAPGNLAPGNPTTGNPATGVEPTPLAGHTGAITGLAVRGELLFSASLDKTVRVWNLKTGAAVRSVNHGAAVGALGVSRDGRRIASGAADGTIRLWNTADGKPLGVLSGRHATLTDLAFSSDGHLLVGTSGESVVLWDADRQLCLQAFPTADWRAVAVGFAAPATLASTVPAPADPNASDGVPGRYAERSLVALGADGTTRRYQPDIQQVLDVDDRDAEGEGAGEGAGKVASVAWLPDGLHVASGAADGTVQVRSLSSGDVTRTLGGPTAAIRSVTVAGDGRRLAAGTAGGQAYVWDLTGSAAATEPLAPFRVFPNDSAVGEVRLSADGRRLAGCGEQGPVRMWDVERGGELERFAGHEGGARAVALAADGRTLVSGGADNTARLWSVSASTIARPAEGGFHDVRFSPDGLRLLAAGDQPRITVWPIGEEQNLAAPAVLPAGAAPPAGWRDGPRRRLVLNGQATRLAVLSADGSVQLLSLPEGAPAGSIPGPPASDQPAAAPEVEPAAAPAGQLAFSPDGTRLIVGRGSSLKVFDVATQRLLEHVPQPSAITNLATIGETGRLVVGRLGTTANAALLMPSLIDWMTVGPGPVTGLAVAPDGEGLITAAAGERLTHWNPADRAVRRHYVGGEQLNCVVITPDGKQVAASDTDGLVRVWPFDPPASPDPNPPAANPPATNSPAGEPPLEIAPRISLEHPAAVQRLAVSANGEQLVVCGAAGLVRVWDLNEGSVRETFLGHAEVVFDAAFAPDHQTLVTAGADLTARLWKMSLVRALPAHEGPVRDLALLAAGAQAATAGEDGKLIVWNLANGEPLRTIENDAAWAALAVRGDNGQVVAADVANRLQLWNLTDGTLTTRFEVPAAVGELAYDADNGKIVAAMRDGALRFYSPEDGALQYELQSEEPATAAAFSADGRQVVSGGEQGGVRLWAYASPEAVRTYTGHGGAVFDVTISPDGSLIASAAADQTARLWNLEAGNQKNSLAGHQGPVYAVTFSPDGALAASCGADGTIRLWDVLGGRQLKQIAGSDGAIYSVAFHPDGKRLACGGLDKQVRLFDATSGVMQAAYEGHEDYVYRVQFNEAGTRLLSCGYGGQLRLWNTANGQPVFEASLDQVTNHADYAPRQDRILVAGGDGRARFIEIPANAR